MVASCAFACTFTEADVSLFIGVTWDMNPYHANDAYASASRFKQRIVPGPLTASLLTHLGGLLAYFASETHFEFQAPVYVGDTITAEAKIVDVGDSKGWARMRCRCTQSDGHEVLRTDVTGFPGRFTK